MLFSGNDFIDADASFDTRMRAEPQGKLFIKAYFESAGVLKTPYFIFFAGSGYAATSCAAASHKGLIGVAQEAVDASASAWVQIRGFCSDVQGAATKLKGSFGHAVYFSAAGVAASASAFVGIDSQWAVLSEDVGGGGSTTAHMWLIGNMNASPLA